jgi:hypothetical protein
MCDGVFPQLHERTFTELFFDLGRQIKGALSLNLLQAVKKPPNP